MAPWPQFFDLKGHAPPASAVSGVTLRNIKGRFGAFGTLRGNPGDTLRDITLQDIEVSLASPEFKPGKVENLVIENVTVNGSLLGNKQ